MKRHNNQAFKIMAATCALGAMMALTAQAEMYRPPATPGGLQIQPVVDPVVTPVSSNKALITITGLQAPYKILVSSNLVDWQVAGVTRLKNPYHTGTALATNVPAGTAYYNLLMLGSNSWVGKWNAGALSASNAFMGAASCEGCHVDKVSEWSATAHAAAYTNMTDTNEMVYRTTGYGQPGGFTSIGATPKLANVTCENCHGSANAHINIDTHWYHPANTLAAEVCGGCHSTATRPTYTEWSSSPHAEVTADLAYGIASYSMGTVYTGTVTATLTNNGTPFSAVLNGYIVLTNGVTNALNAFVNSTNDLNGQMRQMSCGFCHSGATRMAMLGDYEARQRGTTNKLTLPDKWDAAETSQTCAVCHDPHSADNAHQLRNPMWSSNYFTMFTGYQPVITNYYQDVNGNTNTPTYEFMNGGFAGQYNPNINMCGQCHNSRGARWDGLSMSWNAASNAMVMGTTPSFSRPPHHSPQYNVLIGIAQPDYLNTTNGRDLYPDSVVPASVKTNGIGIYAAHSGIAPRTPYNTNQCATCHVPLYTANDGTTHTSHTYEVDTKGCGLSGCHLSGVPDIEGRRLLTTNDIVRVVALLNIWATNQGPVLFTTNYQNYGLKSWDYTTAGALSDSTSTNQGPNSTDQKKLPDAIKQARFNLYTVLHDGSLGVHNPRFIQLLLSDAEGKVLGQFTAQATNASPKFIPAFKAASVRVYTNAPAIFTNLTASLNAGVTNCVWDFGNKSVTNMSVVITNIYTSVGAYTVSLTATDTNGVSRTTTREGYIEAFNKPMPSFTYTPGPYTYPATVSFTNTSQYADYYSWVYMYGVTGTPFDNVETPPAFTYTNAGIYQVRLTAYNLVGSVSVTNVISVGPFAQFSASSQNGVGPFTTIFTSSSVGAVNYNWNFGDGNTSTLANPTNTYAANGAYTVTLTVDNGVLTNTLVRTNYINVGSPVAAFVANKTTGTAPLSVTFTNQSTLANSYKWTFGVGALSSTSTSPSFTYTNAGTYTVTLQAINTGATNTLVKTNYISF